MRSLATNPPAEGVVRGAKRPLTRGASATQLTLRSNQAPHQRRNLSAPSRPSGRARSMRSAASLNSANCRRNSASVGTSCVQNEGVCASALGSRPRCMRCEHARVRSRTHEAHPSTRARRRGRAGLHQLREGRRLRGREVLEEGAALIEAASCSMRETRGARAALSEGARWACVQALLRAGSQTQNEAEGGSPQSSPESAPRIGRRRWPPIAIVVIGVWLAIGRPKSSSCTSLGEAFALASPSRITSRFSFCQRF